MTEDEAEDWLSVATGAVIEYPSVYLHDAARKAQKTCTHHSQVVPAIVTYCEARSPASNPFAWAHSGTSALPAPEPLRLPAPPLTQADVDVMPPELVRIGLKCGALIRDDMGNVLVNPE